MTPRTIAGVIFAAVLVPAIFALAVQPYGHVGAHGRHTVLLKEFGAGVPIAQGFTMDADGLAAVDVRMWASEPVDLAVACTLFTVHDGFRVERSRWRASIRGLDGLRRERLEFPAIDSAGTIFSLELRVTDVSPRKTGSRPEIALVASADRVLRHSSLFVGSQERWGDLVFDTRASGETVLARFAHKTVPRLPAWLRNPATLSALFLLYNGLLVIFIVQVWPSSPIAPTRASAGRPERARGVACSALIVAAVGGALWAARASHARIDLIDQLYAADLRATMPLHQAFDVFDVEIGADTKRVIFAHSTSRIVWHVVPPAGARLRTAIGIEPGVWFNKEGDGVVFRVGVVENGQPTPLLVQYVDGHRAVADQHWLPIDVDLSRFAGRPIDLVLETIPSLEGQPVNGNYDWALWGAPGIVSE